MPQDIVKNNNQSAISGAYELGVMPNVADDLKEKIGKDLVEESPPESTFIKCASKAEATVEGQQTLHALWERDFAETVHRGQ